MNLYEWSQRWKISPQALIELHDMFGTNRNHNPVDMSEAAIQQRVRLKVSQAGDRLFRNNVGVLRNDQGVPVRYGLANESSQMNKVLKSSDLIGITRVLITPDHVGSYLGVFTAYETKKGDWTYKGNDHEVAQWNFIKLVSSLGGIGKFINNADQI